MVNNIEAKNARYTKDGLIDLEINHPVYGWIPFTASINDTEEYGRLIYQDAINGKYGDVQPYIEPEYIEPIIIIDSITMRQARLQLLSMGLLDQIDAIVADNKAYQIEWEYATEIKKDNLLVQGIVQQLGLTSEQLDTMFLEASKL